MSPGALAVPGLSKKVKKTRRKLRELTKQKDARKMSAVFLHVEAAIVEFNGSGQVDPWAPHRSPSTPGRKPNRSSIASRREK